MAIKISKVIKDLNIGRHTVEEFLHKHGIEVEASINARISSDAYQLLVKEFKVDMDMKSTSAKMAQERQSVKMRNSSIKFLLGELLPYISANFDLSKIDLNTSPEEIAHAVWNVLIDSAIAANIEGGDFDSIHSRISKLCGAIRHSRFSDEVKTALLKLAYNSLTTSGIRKIYNSLRAAQKTENRTSKHQEFPIPVLKWSGSDFTDNADFNRAEINSHGWHDLRNDIFTNDGDKIILIPQNQSCRAFDFWSWDDLKTKCPEAIVNGKIIVSKLCSPSGQIPVTPYVVHSNSSNSKEKDNITEDLFEPQTHNPISEPRIVGKIQLEEINLATRPKRKTKEEKKAERLEKISQIRKGVNQKNEKVTSKDKPHSLELIRDIWLKFVEIQEKLIKERSKPIPIEYDEDFEVVDDKFSVTVNTSDQDKIDEIFRNELGVEDYDLYSDHIYVSDELFNNIDSDSLNKICNRLQHLYVELDTTPAINASIDYGDSIVRSDQMTLAELRSLDQAINNGGLIEGYISDTASFICNLIDIKIDDVNRFLFGDHYKQFEKIKKNGTKKLYYRIEYDNSFIPWDTYVQYHESIGLRSTGYSIKFILDDEFAIAKLKEYYWDCYDDETNTFEFKQKFNGDEELSEDFEDTINYNISLFLSEVAQYGDSNKVSVNLVVRYVVDNAKIIAKKYHDIAIAIAGKPGFSFNEATGTLGIDFNWRENDLTQIINELEEAVQFIKIRPYNDDFEQHKFKCRTQIQLLGFDAISKKLRETYEHISIENDSQKQRILIKLPYQDKEVYDELRWHLEHELTSLNLTKSKINFAPTIEGKTYLSMSYNAESRMQDIRDSIMDMKRADFGFNLGDTEIKFGKLLKVNFDDEKIYLGFDIDIDNEEVKDRVIEAFNNRIITTVVPILTGDLEKISRLKNTFTMATTGNDLVNERLQSFIFDSSLATKTEDINFFLRPDGSYYHDINEHLLNEHINETQKQAIIKAMQAEDLAVIQGPPGTGKSTAIAELIWQLVRNGFKEANRKEFILLTSETNLAVDNAIARIVNQNNNLVKPVRFGGGEKLESEGLQFSLELMDRWVREGDDSLVSSEIDEETDSVIHNELILRNWLDNILRRSFDGNDDRDNEVIQRWHNFFSNPNEEIRSIVYRQYLKNVNVIGATCSSIGDLKSGEKDFNGFTSFFHSYCKVKGLEKPSAKKKIKFTTVIQDESSKATPAELVLPFVYGKRAIVIGDHRQLPPMLDHEEFEDSLDHALRTTKNEVEKNEILNLRSFVDSHFDEMEISHFQRLYERIDDSLKGTFNLQYRMHPSINAVIEQFYQEDGGLKCGLTTPIDLGVNDPDFTNPASRYHGIEIKGIINPDTHVLFINSSTPEMLDGTSRVNYGEIDTIDRLLTHFEESDSFLNYLNHFEKEEDKQIGIISFYSKQIKKIRGVASQHRRLPIRVSTVDRFQGMERNIVIVSMVRSNIIQSSKNQRPDLRRYPSIGYPYQHSLGFAQSPNRLNVALSRAKRLLIIIGNKELFSTKSIYNRLFHVIESDNTNVILNQIDI